MAIRNMVYAFNDARQDFVAMLVHLQQKARAVVHELERSNKRYVQTLCRLYHEAGGRPQVWGDVAKLIQERMRGQGDGDSPLSPWPWEDSDTADCVADVVLGEEVDE